MESATPPTDGRQQAHSYRTKNILMLATLMATVTYAAGFNPPGGVWQDTAGHLPGDPVMRSTHYRRFLAFFYFNASAFVLSLMVVVHTLVLAAFPKKSGPRFDWPLWLLMLAATLAFMAAYVTGAYRDRFTVVVFCVLVAIVWLNVMCFPLSINFLALIFLVDGGDDTKNYLRKIISPLSMFALTVSYVGGLSTPGGFWGSAEGGHRPGDTILHGKLLHLFFYFNTAQFVSSLYGVFLVMCSRELVGVPTLSMIIGLHGLTVAYTVGSSRGRHTTVSVMSSLCAAVGAYVVLHVAVRVRFSSVFEIVGGCLSSFLEEVGRRFWPPNDGTDTGSTPNDGTGTRDEDAIAERQCRRASSLVQLLAGLAVSITYQAGMYPPGGVWQDGSKAGDPILLTTNPGRYKAFFYCNSVAFVASLLAIFLGQKRYLIKYHALQAAMILDLLSLVVAYAIGSCRDQISSMYALGIAGAAVVYVVVHVQYFTLGSSSSSADDKDKDAAMVDKMGGRFLLFAILVASITYQAGLTPPGGFLLQDDIHSGHRIGDPVLLYNYPRRYKAFFYCNSVIFMMSTVLLLFLVNPNLYRPAIRSHAMSICSAVSFICLICAFAAGSTQHLKTSIYIFLLAAVAIFLYLLLVLTMYTYLPSGDMVYVNSIMLELRTGAHGNGLRIDVDAHDSSNSGMTEKPRDDPFRKKIYLMTLAILVGSVTYQAGLDPPGGSWQSSSDGHEAGHPVMHDNRRNRYLVFLYANSASFVASIYLIELLLLGMSFKKCKWFLEKAIEPTVVVQYLGFLVAYAAGSSRQWNTSAHVGTLVIAVLAYVATHVMLSRYIKKTS